MIRIDHAEYWFPGTKQPFVKVLAVELDWSGFGTLAGASGAGKTTLFRLLSGWYSPKGAISQFGDGVTSYDDIRFVGAHASLLPWMSIDENLRFHLPQLSHSDIIRLLDSVGLQGEVALLYPYQLSLGMYKRVELIAAVEHCPKLLLLDEFYSSISDSQKELVSEYINSRRGDGMTWITAHEQDLRNWIGGPEFHFLIENDSIVGLNKI